MAISSKSTKIEKECHQITQNTTIAQHLVGRKLFKKKLNKMFSNMAWGHHINLFSKEIY